MLARKLTTDFEVKVMPLDSFDTSAFDGSRNPEKAYIVIITSTFGQGDPPTNAERFRDWLQGNHGEEDLKHISYAVFAFGSRIYEVRHAQAFLLPLPALDDSLGSTIAPAEVLRLRTVL